MVVIGITGGVGAGKSEVLKYIEKSCRCRIVLADDVGNAVKKKGQPCYAQLVSLMGDDVLQEDGEIDRAEMAKKIFADKSLLNRVNACIHPAVQQYILDAIAEERKKDSIDFFFLEAALLIETGYRAVVDELWYIFAEEDVRRKRLRENRGYDDKRIEGIIERQLSEKEFRDACDRVIDNSGTIEAMKLQVDSILGDPLWKTKKGCMDN